MSAVETPTANALRARVVQIQRNRLVESWPKVCSQAMLDPEIGSFVERRSRAIVEGWSPPGAGSWLPYLTDAYGRGLLLGVAWALALADRALPADGWEFYLTAVEVEQAHRSLDDDIGTGADLAAYLGLPEEDLCMSAAADITRTLRVRQGATNPDLELGLRPWNHLVDEADLADIPRVEQAWLEALRLGMISARARLAAAALAS